jgi:heptosyltransferase-2
MFDKSCRRLLVRGVNWIGDGVMTLPALKSLRKALPGTEISLLVKNWVSPIFENNPDIDETIIYGDNHSGLIGRLKLSHMLHKKRFCSAVLFQNALDAALVTFLARIKKRIGYNRDGRGLLLTDAVPTPENKDRAHQIFYYLNLLEQIGIKAEYSYPYIYLTLDERLHAREMLKGMKRPVLGINPGATYGSAKRWFPERFAEVANWFISETGGSAVIFGGKPEVGIADEIFRKMIPEFRAPGSTLSLAGNTSLRDLISLISECDVFLTNDSGPMHVAYAVRTPLVAIFGSTDPALTGPPPATDGAGAEVVIPDLSCSPCFERTCRNNDMGCMYSITPDEVYYAIKRVLPGRRAVFFDRDGTLCKDKGYISRMQDFELFHEIDSISLLKEKEFRLIGISNQSGIARGIVDETFVKEINNIFMRDYGFDDFYYCPHHPDEHCPCRKPEPEMLLRARYGHKINLRKSYVIGDKEADMLLAKAAAAKAILVTTGEARESQNADFTARNLAEAVTFILNDSGSI